MYNASAWFVLGRRLAHFRNGCKEPEMWTAFEVPKSENVTAFQRRRFKKPFSFDRTIVLSSGVVQFHTDPFAWGEIGEAHVSDGTDFGTLGTFNDNSIADFEIDVCGT
jgi:hypothetical protein